MENGAENNTSLETRKMLAVKVNFYFFSPGHLLFAKSLCRPGVKTSCNYMTHLLMLYNNFQHGISVGCRFKI